MFDVKRLKYKVNDKLVASFGAKGWIKVLLRHVSHENYEGSWTEYPFDFAVLDRGDSVAILLMDVKTNELVIVEQFRPAILSGIYELVAGTLKPGEDMIACVKREVEEEVGLHPYGVCPISTFYVSPGGTSERIFLFYAEVESAGGSGLIGGLQQEGENIVKHVLKVKDALAMLDQGVFQDAKTIIALQWLRNERR